MRHAKVTGGCNAAEGAHFFRSGPFDDMPPPLGHLVLGFFFFPLSLGLGEPDKGARTWAPRCIPPPIESKRGG